MHPIEEKILDKILNGKDYTAPLDSEELEDGTALDSLPLGSLSRAFYLNEPLVLQYCEENDSDWDLHFRLVLEAYLGLDKTQPYLDKVEEALLRLPSPMEFSTPLFNTPLLKKTGLQNKSAGTYLMPVSRDLIRQIYQLGDTHLINLFHTHLPIPSPQLFAEGAVPEVIQTRDREVTETMKQVALKTLEPFIIKAQRYIRMQRRYREEVNRIAERDEAYLSFQHMSLEAFKASRATEEPQPQVHEWAQELLQDANTPYTPKCAQALSERIMAAARQVSAFTTVKHITAKETLQSIFDGALYGRRTLMDFYISFRPATLGDDDVLNGDGNVVCLGPQKIDPGARGEITIEFDLSKLTKNNPTAFYKQSDLEYKRDEVRQVRLGHEILAFDHTNNSFRFRMPPFTYLKLFDSPYDSVIQHYARAPKSSFIAYDLERMHEILTLNFFRFIDVMRNSTHKLDQAFTDNFYQKVSQLTDEELIRFLTDLEKNMTDTAEFNFYGAHQIDFESIVSITNKYMSFTLNLPEFITALRLGKLDELRQARLMLPEIFRSYRFVDYLLSKVGPMDVRYYLDDARKQCEAPEWVEHTPIEIPDEFEICWDMGAEPGNAEEVGLIIPTSEDETEAYAAPLHI